MHKRFHPLCQKYRKALLYLSPFLSLQLVHHSQLTPPVQTGARHTPTPAPPPGRSGGCLVVAEAQPGLGTSPQSTLRFNSPARNCVPKYRRLRSSSFGDSSPNSPQIRPPSREILNLALARGSRRRPWCPAPTPTCWTWPPAQRTRGQIGRASCRERVS